MSTFTQSDHFVDVNEMIRSIKIRFEKVRGNYLDSDLPSGGLSIVLNSDILTSGNKIF